MKYLVIYVYLPTSFMACHLDKKDEGIRPITGGTRVSIQKYEAKNGYLKVYLFSGEERKYVNTPTEFRYHTVE